MAENEVYQETIVALQQVNKDIKKTEELISFMRDAKENVMELEATLKVQKARQQNWINALKMRGITLPNE